MKIKIISILLLMLLTTGCWNYRELNTMALVGAIGIDYDKETKMFITSVQIFNAKKTTENSSSSAALKSPITYYESKGFTIHESLRKITEKSPKKLYIGHVSLVVFGESLLKEHFLSSIDFLFRDPESRKDYDIVAAKNAKASDVLKILTPLETNPSASLSQTLISNSDFYGTISRFSFDEAMATVYSEGLELVIPSVEIVGKVSDGKKEDNIIDTTQNTIIKFSENAIFKNNKLIGYLTSEESKGYNFIMRNLKQSIISFPCDEEGNYGSIEITSSKTKMSVKLEKDKIKTSIEIRGTSKLSELNCKESLVNPENVVKMEKKANEEIKKIMQTTIDAAMKKYNSDIFGFGKQLYQNENEYWIKNKKNWDKLFKEIEVSLKSNINIDARGSTTKSAKEG